MLALIETEVDEPCSSLPLQRTKAVALWERLKQVAHDAHALEIYLDIACTQVSEVDLAPRHDTRLLEGTFDFALFRRAAFDEREALEQTILELTASVARLLDANTCIEKRFRGEDKVKITDRLQRHLTEGKALLEVVKSRKEICKTPRRPFEVRRQYAITMFFRLDSLHQQLSAIRAECQDCELLADACAVLLQLETSTARSRARFGRWRDNPSQKLGAKIREEHRQSKLLFSAIEELQRQTKAKCRNLGLKFYNRLGEV